MYCGSCVNTKISRVTLRYHCAPFTEARLEPSHGRNLEALKDSHPWWWSIFVLLLVKNTVQTSAFVSKGPTRPSSCLRPALGSAWSCPLRSSTRPPRSQGTHNRQVTHLVYGFLEKGMLCHSTLDDLVRRIAHTNLIRQRKTLASDSLGMSMSVIRPPSRTPCTFHCERCSLIIRI